ncbi:MAG: M48 family metallopeptidase [Asticcacaulis sp.]|nr:M48 family metallopeptidase [Asticcacaulis sp.]
MTTSFDPAAATSAYLAQLPPETHAKAHAYTVGGHWLLLWSTLVALVVAWLIVRSGILTRIRDGVGGGKPKPWLVVLAVVPAYFILDWVLTLPWALYADWWREKSYGLNNQTWSAWLGEAAVTLAITVVAMTILFAIIYLLVRKAPKTWWLWASGVTAIGAIIAIVLAPVYIEPLFNDYKDVPPGQVRDAIVQLARDNGVPSDKIYVYNGSKQSSRYTANVSGLFGTARVAISDAMLEKASLAEVRGVVGHEMGHYVHMHSLWMTAGFSLIFLIQFWLIHVLFVPAQRLLGAGKVHGIADPAGLPIVFALFAVLTLLAVPATNSIIRAVESDADQFSLDHAGEPDGLAKALVQTIEYRAATPTELEEIIFYDHPSVSRRIRHAMDWKAAHL